MPWWSYECDRSKEAAAHRAKEARRQQKAWERMKRDFAAKREIIEQEARK